ncbi:PREDICTED: protein furry isoform X3 [Papilio xuthus]|uniref:Protein furry isoform X3 n=1 Tax=Papilio xuthus TaxID=66420 RepID=A0AAJ6YZN5_PAPXU|nr:PREDICTED: protein furry isoform X3 [Papilio xuthus]
MITFDVSDMMNAAPPDTHSEDATGMEETPSSMVSSEAESEGSVISEQRAHDSEAPMPFSTDASISDAHGSLDRSAPTLTANDWRNVGNSLASIISTRGSMLPWGPHKGPIIPPTDMDLRPGEYVMRLLFTEFTVQAERKMEAVMAEPLEKPLNKTLQRGEDPQLDQILSAFGTVAEHCLPSLLRALFGWLERQMADSPQLSEQAKKPAHDSRNKSSIIYIVAGSGAGTETTERSPEELQAERRDLAVEFLFCLALIEVLRQLPFHPGHEDLVHYIETLAFKRFNYKEGLQSNPNAANVHIIADLYAEVIGVLAQSRFSSVRKRFTAELKDLKSREPSPHSTQSIISLLMGMKFFRVKMVPIEEFEASFQFLQECAQYFLEVKDKDIRHALAGLFVEILVPVAATVKNEVNVPCLKNFVEMLYSHTLDASTKSKHRLALFPLVTCLLCVSQKQFFLANWHCFLAMCLSHLKNRDPKMCRVALEALYRLLWVYMIRIKCESNSATHSRLQSIVNSLFPKGSKGVVPRDTPLNIFVKIIQFIAQERLDFAMREIVFDLLMVGRPIKIIMTPERMSIGLRAFLVVADSLQQKEGEPPMPRTSGTLPSGNTLRVKKTFLNKMLTDETARSIGMSAYFPYVRRVLVEILRALDAHYGRPLMLTNTQNVTKEQEINTGERKPRIDLFRTCVAAIPRLIPEGMSSSELVDLLCRLTVHMDEELRGLSFQSLQTLIVDFPEWRQDVLTGFTQFLAKDVQDTTPQLVENGLRMLLQLITSWKNGEPVATVPATPMKHEPLVSVLRGAEALGLVMLCQCKSYPRRLAVHILREIKYLLEKLQLTREEPALIDAADAHVPYFAEKCLPLLPPAEKQAILAAGQPDLVWIAERSHAVWTAGIQHDETSTKNSWSASATNGADPWEVILYGLLERSRVPARCPATILQAWPILHARIHALYTIIEPAPVSDNRASLLSRSPALPRKPEKERDGYMQVWKYYMTMAYLVVPAVPSPIIRCASPDLSLSHAEPEGWVGPAALTGSSESLNAPGGFFTLPLSYARAHRHHKRTSSSPDSLSERSGGEARGAHAAPASLHKLAAPLVRCEVSEVRDAAVSACGHINPDALKDLFEELLPILREAVDRKQENMRRRRRRDALRLHLNKMLLIIARRNTFSSSTFALESGGLHSSITEYLDGVRQCLEAETDKDAAAAREQRLTFADFVTELVKSFPIEMYGTLMKKELCRGLFSLFASCCGPLAKHLGSLVTQPPTPQPQPQQAHDTDDRLNLSALTAMSALVCCGPCFAPTALAEDGALYPWLSEMLSSTNDKIYELARETIVLLLERNPDIGPLLDWTVDKCFTGPPRVADGCFMALATIFSAREYPCDHYTAIINVTLMCTGCPRAPVHESALQLLQLLDKRFFGSVSPIATDDDGSEKGKGTLDVLLCTTYCRSQLYLSRQLSQLHPELTMPMFSEITARFQTARTEVRQLLLQYLLPWLVNIELLDPNVPPANPLSYIQYYASEGGRSVRREGLGSVEATEMVLNNLFYITAKFSDNHPKEIEELWSTLCACWPNNLKVIIRYLIIVSGMAPNELLPYAKRVVLYLARSRPERLLDEMMTELQTVETLNCLIERTETPPFYRLTSMRKATSGHSDGPGTGSQDAAGRTGELAPIEKGTIHTKRHSGEDPAKSCVGKACETPGARGQDKRSSGPPCTPPVDDEPPAPSDGDATPTGLGPELHATPTGSAPATPQEARVDAPQPRPLPMPEYGGYFALLTEYLPDSNQPISGFHRCNVAVMLLCDVVLDGVEIDWSIHVPLMLHIVFLGMDHTRWIVHQHCRQLLLNLLVAVAAHHDHLTVARTLLASRSAHLGLTVTAPPLPLLQHNFTEPDATFDKTTQCAHSPRATARSLSTDPQVTPEGETDKYPSLPVIITGEGEAGEAEGEGGLEAGDAGEAELPVADVIKSLVHFLANRPTHMPLWQYEDITAKVWSLRSCQQMATLARHALRVFRESLPHALVSERWAQTALQLGLSCPSRHYAGRSLQVFRFIGVAMTGRMVTDILSRLVETVAEQGEDMQGYVTELLLTLEAAVDSLESNFRPLDYMRDIFKSTPNLNNKDGGQQPNGTPFTAGKRSPGVCVGCASNHTRSTSYSVSAPYCVRKPNATASSADKQSHDRSRPCSDSSKGCSNLCRSRSAQSLKLLGDSATQDDKLTILATLFWVGASLLESDYEHEFLLGVRLLARVMARLPLDRPDARDRLDRTQAHAAPALHALLLKGCTHPNTYEPVVGVLADMIPLLELPVIDPTQSMAFPMTVVALLPYMLLHYEDATELCVRAACHIAQFTAEKSKKLENLGTVMTLYSRRTFSKESFQWTKCVVKYLWDTYSHLSLQMLAFLVEVLEKGAASLQPAVLSILHCMLHYVELNAPAAQPVNADLLRAVSKFIGQDNNNYKEAMKILKLVVTRCSTLVVPPHWDSHASSILDTELHGKKELPGRTMDFTFDLSQTPVIGRKYLPKSGSQPPTGPSSLSNASSTTPDKGSSTSGSASTVVGPESGGRCAGAGSSAGAGPHSAASPRRSLSLSPADALASGWKRPWMSQSRVRECLVNLLTTCGQRVGLPKSPSVIFSQSSELLERESSMTSSLEEVSGTPGNEPSGGAPPTDHFGVFKDFDFLEYESESIEGESSDNFNWGVRRRLPSEERPAAGSGAGTSAMDRSPPPQRARHHHHRLLGHEDSSDEEGVWEEGGARGDADASGAGGAGGAHELTLRTRAHSFSSASSGERGDVTPVPSGGGGASGVVAANIAGVATSAALRDAWRCSVAALLRHAAHLPPVALVHRLHTVLKEVTCKTVSVCGESALGGAGAGELAAVVARLAGEEPPLLWAGPAAADCARVRDAVRFAALEINEHLETYFDRREHALEMLELSRSGEETARSLYKLIFQLLLLLETNNKMVVAVYHAALDNRGVEMSAAVCAVRNALAASAADSWGETGEACEGVERGEGGDVSASPSPAPAHHDDAKLTQLMQRQRWAAALALVRERNAERILERGELPEDDVTSLLHVYCKGLAQAHPEMVAITRPVNELSQNLSFMMESLYKVSVALQRQDY